jgi:hypothetical protein
MHTATLEPLPQPTGLFYRCVESGFSRTRESPSLLPIFERLDSSPDSSPAQRVPKWETNNSHYVDTNNISFSWVLLLQKPSFCDNILHKCVIYKVQVKTRFLGSEIRDFLSPAIIAKRIESLSPRPRIRRTTSLFHPLSHPAWLST